MISLGTPHRKWASSRLEGRTSWIFSSCSRSSRLTTWTSETRPHPEEPSFHLLARKEGSFPCEVGKEFPAFPSHLKKRSSPQERREEIQGRATIPRVPQMSQSISGKPDFPALPRISSRGSTHTTMAPGTAPWESLVGKPRGKATDPLIHEKGSLTLLLQLGWKAHVHAPTQDDD